MVLYLWDYLLISYLRDLLSFLTSQAVVNNATPPPMIYGKYSISSSSDIVTAF